MPANYPVGPSGAFGSGTIPPDRILDRRRLSPSGSVLQATAAGQFNAAGAAKAQVATSIAGASTVSFGGSVANPSASIVCAGSFAAVSASRSTGFAAGSLTFVGSTLATMPGQAAMRATAVGSPSFVGASPLAGGAMSAAGACVASWVGQAVTTAAALVSAVGKLVASVGTVSAPAISGDASCTFNSDGSLSVPGIGTFAWFTPTQTGIGSGYWIKVSPTLGAMSVSPGAINTWVSLGSGVAIGIVGTAGLRRANYSIASDSAGVHVVASSTIQLDNAGGG